MNYVYLLEKNELFLNIKKWHNFIRQPNTVELERENDWILTY